MATHTKKSDTHEIKATNLNAEDKRYLEEHGDELSDSTKRARWIHSPSEKADRNGQTLATRSHDVIKHWAEGRDAVPVTVPGTKHGDHAGVLRFRFNATSGNDGDGKLKEISWDDWFRSFDDRHLVFVFQDRKSNGDQSNFFILDNPNREDG